MPHCSTYYILGELDLGAAGRKIEPVVIGDVTVPVRHVEKEADTRNG